MSTPTFPRDYIGRRGVWRQRAVGQLSDGDQKSWPQAPAYRPISDEGYLIKLGEEWVKADGLREAGVQYYIDKLPSGYALFGTASGDGSQHYKRLFGHPSGKFYDSTPTFLPHFLWLQEDMQGDCPCKICSGKGQSANPIPRMRRPRNALDSSNILSNRIARDNLARDSDSPVGGLTSNRARRDVKQTGAPYARDEEGTEDVYKLFIKRLEAARNAKRSIEEAITETNSIDWRAEHVHGDYGEDDILAAHLTRIEQQHSFVPRSGELVLFCADIEDEFDLMLEKSTMEYKLYSFDERQFLGHPKWRAGVVTEVPNAQHLNGPPDFADILGLPETRTAGNTAAFRVETMPDPNGPLDKSRSKQYKFLPLRNIRPLSHWQSVLRGIPEKKLHSSIKNALTCMTSVSLVDKFKAVGKWPVASIFCKGVFLGSEMIIIGDVIRLVSARSPSKQCTDVMVVESIRLNLEDIQEEHSQPRSLSLSSTSDITFTGSAYTLDRSRFNEVQPGNALPAAVPRDIVKVLFQPVGSTGYGPWYPLLPPHQKLEVSYDRVLGRLYEAEAMRLWMGSRQQKVPEGETLQLPPLNFDVAGIMSARHFATSADERLPASSGNDVLWFWADSRAQGLDLATINGLQVGAYHDIRDKDTLDGWQEAMKVLNGTSTPISSVQNFTSILTVGARGRKPGSKLVNGKIVYPGDPEYPSGPGDAIEPDSPARAKAASQMAGAMLASTDEEESESDEDGGSNLGFDSLRIEQSEPEASKTSNYRPSYQSAPRPPTKAQTMSTAVLPSIEPNREDDNEKQQEESEEDDSDEDEWWDEPKPLLRGGTEESEGGDYTPQQFSKTQLFERVGRKPKR